LQRLHQKVFPFAEKLITIKKTALLLNSPRAIRFERVAGLTAGQALEMSTVQLTRLYCENFGDNSAVAFGLPDIALSLVGKTSERRATAQDRSTWLWTNTLSETTKRLAGLSGCGSTDKSGFEVFFSERIDNLLTHPLIVAVGDVLADNGWVRVDVDAEIVDKCFADFQRYQQPLAELLHAKYSLRSSRRQGIS
jgi:hypothetical protein